MLEIPSARRRIFIEFETGSATIKDSKKSTSTLAKLDRYETFFVGRPGTLRGNGRTSFYEGAFPDRWTAELLFVTPSAARRNSIAAVLKEHASKWVWKGRATAMALEEVQGDLTRILSKPVMAPPAKSAGPPG
jgi:hypothetical protein